MVAPGTPPPDSLPSAFRASDDDRDDAIRVLRDGSVAGRLSNDTFLRRVDRALRARRMDELAGLLGDLPSAPEEGAGPGRAAKAWSRLAERLRGARFPAAWPGARLPRLVLPRGPRTVFTIGRSPDCDLPLGDITVSWHHAELRRADQAGSAMRKAAAPKLTQSPARTANPESALHPLTRVPFFEPTSTSTQA